MPSTELFRITELMIDLGPRAARRGQGEKPGNPGVPGRADDDPECWNGPTECPCTDGGSGGCDNDSCLAGTEHCTACTDGTCGGGASVCPDCSDDPTCEGCTGDCTESDCGDVTVCLAGTEHGDVCGDSCDQGESVCDCTKDITAACIGDTGGGGGGFCRAGTQCPSHSGACDPTDACDATEACLGTGWDGKIDVDPPELGVLRGMLAEALAGLDLSVLHGGIDDPDVLAGGFTVTVGGLTRRPGSPDDPKQSGKKSS